MNSEEVRLEGAEGGPPFFDAFMKHEGAPEVPTGGLSGTSEDPARLGLDLMHAHRVFC